MIRVAITGPESSGKTTLARQLSEELGGAFIPEFAREYLNKTEGTYNFSDLDNIAKGHLNRIEKSQNSIQIIDTDFCVMKIWSEYRFGKTSTYIEKLLNKNMFDFHFLCPPEVTWEHDPLRENPDDREELFQSYVELLNDLEFKYHIISGTIDQRLEKCLRIIHDRLN